MITSDDMESDNPEVFPIGHPALQHIPGQEDKGKIILAKLRGGQELMLECTARKGVAKDHAKWSPVATAVFRFQPEIIINEEMARRLTPQQKRDIVDSSPTPILRYDEATDSVREGLPCWTVFPLLSNVGSRRVTLSRTLETGEALISDLSSDHA